MESLGPDKKRRGRVFHTQIIEIQTALAVIGSGTGEAGSDLIVSKLGDFDTLIHDLSFWQHDDLETCQIVYLLL